MKYRKRLLFAAMVFLWGLAWPVQKIGLGISYPFIFVAHRLLFTSVFLVAVSILTKARMPRDWKTLIRVTIYSLVSTLSFAATTVGLASHGSGFVSVLMYTQPIMVFILGVTFLGEAFSVLRLLGIALGFSGVAALFLQDGGSALSWTAFLVLIGAFFWAVGTVYYKLKLQSLDAQVVNLAQATSTTIVMFVASMLTEPLFEAWSTTYLATLAYAGIGAAGVGMTIWLVLLEDEEATLLSGSSLVVPVLALFFSWILIGEELNVQVLLGSLLVLGGVYLVNKTQSKSSNLIESPSTHQRI